MLLQDFLRANSNPLALLEASYAIKAKRHSKYHNLVQLKYNQIESPMNERLVQQARGVIFDETNNWEVVARPFDKFFNDTEGFAAQIDWSTARVQEKLDGSLMLLYMYDNAWHVGTSGTPDASGNVNGFDMSFADLFWKVFNDLGYKLPNQNSEHVCYMFELMTKYNRVVVPHDKERLVLIGVRDKWGHEYHPGSIAIRYGYECVKEFPLQTVDQVRESFSVIDPLHQEGYVVVDNAFSRVKMKHPGYVALHHMKDGMSPRKALEVVRVGESSEVLAHFPEWKEYFDIAQTALDELKSHLETEYEKIKDIPSQKEFALQACKTRLSGALFSLRAKKVSSIAQYLAEMQIDTLVKTLGIKTTETVSVKVD